MNCKTRGQQQWSNLKSLEFCWRNEKNQEKPRPIWCPRNLPYTSQ